mmetsp:Transcript_95381/g.309047  ORF Transcript_95381/g.309047 Transcript_95381/m.309047 type:complete len:98 (+) Transcript_95381:558-851(+)
MERLVSRWKSTLCDGGQLYSTFPWSAAELSTVSSPSTRRDVGVKFAMTCRWFHFEACASASRCHPQSGSLASLRNHTLQFHWILAGQGLLEHAVCHG